MEKGAFRRKEAAQFIGASLPTLDELLHRAENPIPHIQIGRRIMIPVRDLQDWLSAEARRNGAAV